MENNRTRHFLQIAFLLVPLALLPGATQTGDKPEVLLQTALHKEMVEGDLEEAIQLYKAIIAEQEADRSVAARALRRMGYCYEKLGNPEAYEAYEQVVREYPDQLEPARLAGEGLKRLESKRAPGTEDAAAAGPSYQLVLNEGLKWAGNYLHAAPFDFAPNGEEFVFETDIEVASDIHSGLKISDAAGRLARPLVVDFENWFGFGLPRWSPDGRQIAYVANQRRNPPEQVSAVFVVTAEGDTPRQIGPTFTHEGNRGKDLCWTPDGRKLTYLNSGKLYSLALDGMKRELIPYSNAEHPLTLGGYSPDGRWLAFQGMPDLSSSLVTDIWILPAEGGMARSLVHTSGINAHPIWATDGQAVYFISNRSGDANIWKIGVAMETGRPRGEPQQITFFNDVRIKYPRLFDDGGRMAFGLEKGSGEIWIAEPSHPEEAQAIARGSNPRLSPDGQTIYYLGEGSDQAGIFAVPRWGGTPKRLTRNQPLNSYFWPFDLSPDGQTLAYFTNEGDGFSLYTLNVNEGRPRLLTTGAANDYLSEPCWSPDGSRLAYSNQNSLFSIPAEGGKPQKLAELYRWEMIRWSPDGKYIGAFAYISPEEEVALFVIPALGGPPKRLTNPAELGYKEGLDWHPDGKRLTYMRYLPAPTEKGPDSELREAYLDGRPTSLMLNQPDHWDYIGIWAPDGKQFFFHSTAATGEEGLYIYDSETSKTRLFAPLGWLLTWSDDGKTMSWPVSHLIHQLWLMQDFQ